MGGPDGHASGWVYQYPTRLFYPWIHVNLFQLVPIPNCYLDHLPVDIQTLPEPNFGGFSFYLIIYFKILISSFKILGFLISFCHWDLNLNVHFHGYKTCCYYIYVAYIWVYDIISKLILKLMDLTQVHRWWKITNKK